jgi:hypothetical protein
MASKAQIDRIAARIEALAPRILVPEPPPEQWIVDGDAAYQLSHPDRVITVAELAARPGWRIEHMIVDPAPAGGAA